MEEELYYLCSFEYESNAKCKIIDPEHTINIFKIMKIENDKFKIIEILRNNMGKFCIDDILYIDNSGMIGCCTKNENNEIKEIDVNYINIIHEDEIEFYSEKIEDKLEETLNLIK